MLIVIDVLTNGYYQCIIELGFIFMFFTLTVSSSDVPGLIPKYPKSQSEEIWQKAKHFGTQSQQVIAIACKPQVGTGGKLWHLVDQSLVGVREDLDQMPVLGKSRN